MQKKSMDIEPYENDVLLLESETFIPIDVEWRKTYYKRVLKKRVYAFLLDLITTVPFAYLIAIVLMSIYFGLFHFDNGVIEEDMDISVFQTSLVLFGWFLPFGIMESLKMKGTFGKRIMKIEITDSYGNRISFWRSLGRNILKFLTIYSYLFIIPLIIQFFTYRKTKKLFHDFFSSTIIGERL